MSTASIIFCTIILVAVTALGIILISKIKSKKVHIKESNELNYKNISASTLTEIPINTKEIILPVKALPIEAFPENNKLVEITNSKALAQINNIFPELMQTGNTLNNASQAISNNGKTFYEAIIPAGTHLAKSKNRNDAFRGFCQGSNGKIKAQADFVPTTIDNGASIISNTVSTAMNLVSVVVGQYYMSQVHNQLDAINDHITKISNFQNNEYISRIGSLISHINEITNFQLDIINNNELRLAKINQLYDLEKDCTELLYQANFTLSQYADKKCQNYKNYVNELTEAHYWYICQQSLMEILYKIADLKFTLNIGTESREHCNAFLKEYKEMESQSLKRIKEWHKQTDLKLNINIDEIRRKRTGVDGAIHFIPGLIKNEWKFKSIEENVVNMILSQTSDTEAFHKQNTTNLYTEDVHLISKDGKIYYFPSAS